MSGKFYYKRIFLFLSFFVLGWVSAQSQTTEFTYQGRFNDGGQAATGNYDFEFRLFDTETGGTQIVTQQRLDVAVANGVFSVRLDFGANFNGQARFFEIGARRSGTQDTFTILTPRQSFTSTPYAIRSLDAANSAQLGGVDASQFVTTTDPRMTDERNPAPNSPNYIQNATTQQTANFNISGNGNVGGSLVANSVISQSNFSIANNNAVVPVLSIAGRDNIFVGSRSGERNSTGTDNAFFGAVSGVFNTTGFANSFFGRGAGTGIRTGSNNTFLGANTAGLEELNFATAVGAGAQVLSSNTVVIGRNVDAVQIPGALDIGGTFFANTVNAARQYNIGGNRILGDAGEKNLFAGIGSGQSNINGSSNAFFGSRAGALNTTGSGNSIFGAEAGFSVTNGGGNSFFGNFAGGQTTGSDNSFFGNGAGRFTSSGSNNTAVGAFASVSNNLSFATAIGSGAIVSTSNTIVLGRPVVDTVRVSGSLVVLTLGISGSQTLCRNTIAQISICSSSLRYKTNINPFTSGLALVERLRPITFHWKAGGTKDLGLGAEEVAEVEPLLVNYNDNGEVEGVKYDRITVVLLNAVKEQQAQIEKQTEQIAAQEKQIREQDDQIQQQQFALESLKQIVCESNAAAKICQ